MASNYIQEDTASLDKLVKELGKKYYVDVGITGKSEGKTYADTGIPVAVIGAVHEFGSMSRNIPERSFIRVPLQTHAADIESEVRAEAQQYIEKGDIKGVFQQIGIQAQRVIQEAFDSKGGGLWPANSPETIKRKGSDMPLVDTGELRKAITYKVGTN